MPIEASILTPEDILPLNLELASLKELAGTEPDGVYTITRTYQHDKTVMLDAHFDRLEESARLEGMPLTLDRTRLRLGLKQIIERSGFDESRFRISIPNTEPDRILLAAEPLPPIPAQYRETGVATATAALERSNPRAKSNAWEQQRAQAARHLPPGVYEGLIVDEQGQILEGFSSNFYGVMDNKLRTAELGILHGISRRILLAILPPDLELLPSPVNLDEVGHLHEAFITSSSRGVLPVITIDGMRVGRGTPGPLTRDLSRRFDSWVLDHLEPI